jgi:hypothetical protein
MESTIRFIRSLSERASQLAVGKRKDGESLVEIETAAGA